MEDHYILVKISHAAVYFFERRVRRSVHETTTVYRMFGRAEPGFKMNVNKMLSYRRETALQGAL